MDYQIASPRIVMENDNEVLVIYEFYIKGGEMDYRYI